MSRSCSEAVKMESSGLPITRAASANQNITNSIPCEKPEEWPPFFAYWLRYSNRAKDWWVLNKTFKVSNDASSSMMRDINYKQMRQITFVSMHESDLDHHAHGGLIESLWDCNYGRNRLALCRDFSVVVVVVVSIFILLDGLKR